jgi:4-hydroxythreonine-4-phosphate dehydrogenase
LKSKSKPIAISFGDPCGIGPEVIVKALSKIKNTHFIIVGDYDIYRYYGGRPHKRIEFIHVPFLGHFKKSLGRFDRESGAASLAYLEKATELIQRKEASGLVTAPLSKEAVSLTFMKFSGHTEFLAKAFGVRHVDMMFVAEDIKVTIVTRHISLKEVTHQLSTQKVFQTIKLTSEALRKLFKIKDPTIGVCGINPHAGEGGLIGDEDERRIAPALKKAKRQKIRVEGPLSADTAFTPKSRRHYDALIAMYHDQGLAPIKALYFDKLVNLTIGLPFIRTSPAHGTAFNIAGQNKADATSMLEAIRLATRLTDA